jgi:serine phosphatase RsbU (regulator of sigma subunit)
VSETSPPPSPPPGSGVPSGRRDDLRVLLVEDDEGDAVLVTDDLAESLPRANLLRARSLAEALTHASSGLDCVLLDLGLPDATGLVAVERIRHGLAPVPLIVLTGLYDEAAGVAAVDAGAQDYLVKGRVSPGELARAILYALARRQTEAVERELLLAEAQAREAHRLERGLIPKPVVTDNSIWVESCYRPGRSRALLGGDFLDLLQTPNGAVRAVVGDVCGHGADEAAVGVSMRAAWRALAVSGANTELMLQTLSEMFKQERHVPSLFATLCALEVDASRRQAKLTLAGHPSPLLIEGSSVRTLAAEERNPAIGIGTGEWRSEHVELPAQWAILLYTDGMIEGLVDPAGGRLEADGLRRMIEDRLSGDTVWLEHPLQVLDDVLRGVEEVNGGPLPDDAAMLLFGTRGGDR